MTRCESCTLCGDVGTASEIKVLFFPPLFFSMAALVLWERALCVFKRWWTLKWRTKTKGKKIVPRSVWTVRASLPLPWFFFSPSTAVNLRDLSPRPLTPSGASEQEHAQIFNPGEREKNAEITPIYTPPPILSLPSPCSRASAEMCQRTQGFYLMQFWIPAICLQDLSKWEFYNGWTKDE